MTLRNGSGFRQPAQQSGGDKPEKDDDEYNAGAEQSKREVFNVERCA
jgi:hypothetical protein